MTREDFDNLKKELRTFPEEDKRLVMLRYVDGLTDAEIALVTGMPDKTVPRVIGALEAKVKALEASTRK